LRGSCKNLERKDRNVTNNEKFISLLSSIDEDYYFQLATTFLGKVTTPFHKPDLSMRIASFFSNVANQKNILSSLDENEKQILEFISILGLTTKTQMEAFFSSTNLYLLHLRLSNLCDRLILIYTKKGYVINPLLENLISSIGSIGRNTQEPSAVNPYADSNVLRAIINLLSNGLVPSREANIHHFYKSGKLLEVFPKFQEENSIRIFELYKRLLIQTSTIEKSSFHININRDMCKKLFGLNSLALNLATIQTAYGQNVATSCARCLNVLAKIPIQKSKLLALLNATAKESVDENLINDLCALGLVYESDNLMFFNNAVLEEPVEMSALTIDTDLQVSYFGVPKENDILFLFSSIQKCDNLVVYAITKDSFSRALDFGLTREEIENYLKTQEISSNNFVLQMLEQWEKALSRVKLYDGLVLECSQELAALIQQIPDLYDNIIAKLSPCIFLMKSSTQSQWRKTLAKALDMENLPAPIEEKTSQELIGFTLLDHFNVEAEANFTVSVIKGAHQEAQFLHDNDSQIATSWNDTKKDLLDDAKNKGCLSKELEELIDAKLIVSKSQISKDFRYTANPTVGGFDYNAKLALIKKALKSKASQASHPLRLELLDETFIAIPLEIRGTGANAILQAILLPNGEEKNIKVGSIFQVSIVRTPNFETVTDSNTVF